MNDLIVLDCEVYPNFFLLAMKRIDTGKLKTFHITGESSRFSDTQKREIHKIMLDNMTFGFNSRNFDMPIILYALQSASCKHLCNMSNAIIAQNIPGWLTINDYELKDIYPHFDIAEPSPGVMISLKSYGANIHSKKIQDLPIEPNTILTERQIEDIILYCENDLDTTIDLYREIKPRIDLRGSMVKDYGMQVLSKSDAQIAEVVIAKDIERITGSRISKPSTEIKKVNYSPPRYIKFKNLILKELLNLCTNTTFKITNSGSVELPKALRDFKIEIGDTSYQIGIGGLHSKERCQAIIPKHNEKLIDKDVISYYPSIILNERLAPKHLGNNFLTVYQSILDKRLAAKKAGDQVTSEGLKIVLNGSFGKFGNRFSKIYSPELMLAVTLTGQLSLLMIIERLEAVAIKVVSANTDGFVSIIPDHLSSLYQTLCFEWEMETGFTLETTEYKALYSRDVNNYLAIKSKGYKGKGVMDLVDSYSLPIGSNSTNVGKGRNADIVTKAVIDKIMTGKRIDKTVKQCDDVRQFLFTRKVAGGALWGNQYLGRVVRWIYSKEGQAIRYKKNGNLVAKSASAMPIMELCDIPVSIDRQAYINEANQLLKEIGYNE
jgi:hypothetical protein